MARSTHIYLVLHPDDCETVIAAFTVKWEMESWCNEHLGRDRYAVLRARDGLRYTDAEKRPVEID